MIKEHRTKARPTNELAELRQRIGELEAADTERRQADSLIRIQRDLGLALSAEAGLDEGLRLCCEAALKISGMDCGGVYLVDDASGALDLVFHQGLTPDFVKSASYFDAGSASARLVMAGEPIYAEHSALGVPLHGARKRENLRAVAILPVRHEDRVIGCLNIASHSMHGVPVFARDALETIVTQIGGTIARLRTEEALRRSVEDTAYGQRLLLALSQAAQAVQRARTDEEVYRTVGDEVAHLGYHAVIFTLADDMRHLTIRHLTFDSGLLQAAERLTGAPAKGYRIPMEPGGFYDQVARKGAVYLPSILGPMMESMPRMVRPSARRLLKLLDLQEAIYAPLIVGGEMQGLLLVAGRGLTEGDVPAVTIFATQAAIALENARLYQEVRHHAQGLVQRVAERTDALKSAQIAALNMMEDAEAVRKRAEQANERLRREIAERRQSEEALRASEERYRNLFDRVPVGLYRTTREGQILDANPTLVEMLGYPDLDSLRATRATGIIVKREEHLQELALQEHEGIARDAELQARRWDGSVLWVRDVARAIRDHDGDVVCYEGSLEDITERRRAEEERQRLLAGLERSNRELAQFAYVASHDLQEPLRMVSSYVQLLARRYKGKLDADADDFIAFAVDGANRMRILIQDLLTYSRVGTRGKELSPTDCEAVLDQVLAILRLAIEENDATVTHDPLPTVMADDVQLGQLFQNLIGNALKFHGEAPPQISIGAEHRGDEWLFSVSDNGIGIDPENHERIFQVFQRLHTRGEYPGTGIGLAVCKKIVERHHGRIWVESELGKGSTFYFTMADGDRADDPVPAQERGPAT